MHKAHIFIAIVCLAFTEMVYSQVQKLTVVVLVDGLRQENMVRLRPYWSQGGLRTLEEESKQGMAACPFEVYDGNETVATLLTGCLPSVHGVTMSRYFSRQDRKIHSILEDKNEKGIGSTVQMSPRELLSVTIADRYRFQYGRDTKIYAIGLSPETTIMMGGHSADACCWLNRKTQRWATTSYYRNGLPNIADEMNRSGRLTEVAAATWIPRMDMSLYSSPTNSERKKGFSYTSGEVLPNCPAANQLVVELALNMQRAYQLGKRDTPDLLLLQMTTSTPAAKSDIVESAEQEDSYLALNQHLGYLLEQLVKRVGRDNLQVMVVGIPRKGMSVCQLKEIGMPVHYFNVDRAAALTSTYLIALYGHERWVDGGFGQSIYLNRDLIEQKRMSLETIRMQVADFLMDFEGVRAAYPMHDAFLNPQLCSSLTKKTSGDVVFTLESGWLLTYGEKDKIDHVVDNAVSLPFYYWSGKNEPEALRELNVAQVMQLLNR